MLRWSLSRSPHAKGEVIAYKFMQHSKRELFGRMKMAMSKGLKLPQDKLLVRELNSFYSVISDSGNILLKHARRGLR